MGIKQTKEGIKSMKTIEELELEMNEAWAELCAARVGDSVSTVLELEPKIDALNTWHVACVEYARAHVEIIENNRGKILLDEPDSADNQGLLDDSDNKSLLDGSTTRIAPKMETTSERIQRIEIIRNKNQRLEMVENWIINGPTQEELLTKYRRKQPTPFVQFDAFVGIPNDEEDCIMHYDSDGHCMFGGMIRHELMHGANVRVLVRPSTSARDVVAMLEKIAEWIKTDSCDTDKIEMMCC